MHNIVVAPQELELVTHGQFKCDHAVNENTRCGPIGTPREFAYEVKVISCPQFLDPNGFVIDWQIIEAYFAEKWRDVVTLPSCEIIACSACEDILELLEGRCVGLEVSVGAGKVPAGMKAKWRRDSNTF